jgi:cobalamin-independent methionine synthase catalytic subunit
VADRAYPWPPGTATGLGPFPGTDPGEAARVVFGELAKLPFLPQLPARGVGSDAVGRTAGLLVELFVDLQPGGWRLVPHPGRDLARARAAMASDLDALEEAAEGHEGPLKLQIVGPWTMAGSLELARGEKALADEGAVRDLAGSLAEGVAAHVADVRRRLPGVSDVVVQLDEPLLPAVLDGRLPTQSGWGRLRAVEEPVAVEFLTQVLTAAGDHAGVHTGGAAAPLGLLRLAGAGFVGLDAELLEVLAEEDMGEALEGGTGLVAGIPHLEKSGGNPRTAAEPVSWLWRRLSLAPEMLAQAVAVAPRDGLEHLAPDVAATVLRRAVELGRHLEEAGTGDSD